MKYTKILIPLDGSKLAEAILPYGSFLAGALQLPVDLMHVNDSETAAPSMHPPRGADYLSGVAAASLSSLTVNCCVKNGGAAEVILDTASADAGVLIAMATHGQSGGQRWLLGRIAQKVLQASKNPLVLIRPDQGGGSSEVRLNRIIVPLDGSRLAEQILPHVVYLAAKARLEVVLFRTYALPSTIYFAGAGLPAPDKVELEEKMNEEGRDYLQAQVERLSGQGIAEVTFVVEEGRGPEQIINLAQRTSNSMVVMSTHGRSGISRWVLGSVADRVVSYSGAPVLVVRPVSSQT